MDPKPVFSIYQSPTPLINDGHPVDSSGPNDDHIDAAADAAPINQPRRRFAVNPEQLQKKITSGQRIRLAILYYFRKSSIARFIFIMTCFIWFMFNFTTVTLDFLAFDTVVFMEYIPPKETRPPGLTFCTPCIYCHRKNQSSLNKMSVHRAIHNDVDDEDGKNLFPYDQQVVSLNLSDIIRYCVVYPTANTKAKSNPLDPINCTDFAPVVATMQEGHKCYTFFSDVFGTMTRFGEKREDGRKMLMEFDRFPSIEIGLYGKHLSTYSGSFLASGDDSEYNENLDNNQMAGISLAIHSPTIFPAMYGLSYHRVFPKKYMHIAFLKMTEKRKPFPYKTKCFPYDKNIPWAPPRQEGFQFDSDQPIQPHPPDLGYFRSRGECFIYCMWRMLGHRRDCLNFYTIFTQHLFNMEKEIRILSLIKEKMEDLDINSPNHWQVLKNLTEYLERNFDLKFCQINQSYELYGEVKDICLENCLTECLSETFWIDTSYNMDMSGHDNDSLVHIEWSTKSEVYIEHREKFTLSGFLGNVGGHAHIWLGISLIAICRFIIINIQQRDTFRTTGCCWSCFWLVDWIRGFHIKNK